MKTAWALVVAALLVLPAFAADWPQFRGPRGSGVSQEKGLADKWGLDEGLRWKAKLPGRGLSNPVIAGGRIYVTACSKYRHMRLHVLCFDEKTGKKLWERQFTSTGNTGCHQVTSMAAPTPVTDGKAVYALFATGDLAGLSKDGDLLWYRSLVGDYPDVTNQVGMASSPVLVDGVLCLPMDNAGDSFVAGVDAKTGKNLWRKKRRAMINWITPTVVPVKGKPAVVFTNSDEAIGYDVKSGKEVLSVKAKGMSGIPSPTYVGGVLYLPGSEDRVSILRAFRDGKEAWVAKRVSSGYPTVVVHDKRIYGLSGDFATCFDAKTGTQLWRKRLEGPFEASPIVADGKLYAVNNRGRTFVVELGDTPKELGRNDLKDKIQATPAVANGCIYLRSDKALYCIGPKKD